VGWLMGGSTGGRSNISGIRSGRAALGSAVDTSEPLVAVVKGTDVPVSGQHSKLNNLCLGKWYHTCACSDGRGHPRSPNSRAGGFC
jgi:hypothetical protein